MGFTIILVLIWFTCGIYGDWKHAQPTPRQKKQKEIRQYCEAHLDTMTYDDFEKLIEENKEYADTAVLVQILINDYKTIYKIPFAEYYNRLGHDVFRQPKFEIRNGKPVWVR